MSIRQPKKKRETGPLPSSGAGLLRYFDEELPGIKLGPVFVIGFTFILIVVVLLAGSSFWPWKI